MLNPNNPRTNTVISQSFIASEFQGFNDPFVNSQPTSSLNQLVKSKQTSQSGIFKEQLMDNPGQGSFGFNDITQTSRQPQSFARKPNERVQVNVIPSQQPITGYNNAAYQQQYSPQQQQFANQPQSFPQQQFAPMNQPYQQAFNQPVPAQQLQQRYITPQVTKTESPTRPTQSFPPQTQPVNTQQFTQPSPKSNDPLSMSRPQQQQPNQLSSSNLQQSRTQNISQQYSQKLLEGSRASTQQTGQVSSMGKRLKLNVSQQFSNSFVLKCVNEPQKSSILQMKQRQRQYRKSIQNFFV